VRYDGIVYNLEVAGNNTYVVQNSVVHNCYGTGFKCGYFYPVSCVWAELQPKNYHLKIDTGQRGPIKDVATPAKMLMTDLLSEEDVWVADASDDRYYVHEVQHTDEVRGVPVIAQVMLRVIPYSSPIYKIEIPDQLASHGAT
jgi:hypothetical protein